MPEASGSDNWNPSHLAQMRQDFAERLVEHRPRGLRLRERLKDLIRGRSRGEALRSLARKQPREKAHAIRRQLHQRLVHEVHVEVAAPDVGNEDDRGFERRDIGEVLVRPTPT
jgi:hypothetical protein